MFKNLLPRLFAAINEKKKITCEKLLSFSLLITSSLITVLAQVPLDTFIGQTSLPNDDDAVCYIPIYPEITTELPEPLEAELVHDFKLYTLEEIQFKCRDY